MAASHRAAPALRHLVTCQTRALRASNQRRWAQVHDVRFLATAQPTPRPSVLEKYRGKLEAKARAEGLAGVGELQKAYAERIEELRRRDAVVVPPAAAAAAATSGTTTTASAHTSPPPASSSPPRSSPQPSFQTATTATTTSSSPAPPAPQPSSTSAGVKPLSAILDLDKARALPVKELTAIWRLRHASSERNLCAVIPAPTYAAMESLGRARPQFVLPVPHPGQGAEMHFLQWTFDAATRTSTVLFTQLAEYKARGEWAAPHTTVTHHADLAADKGVVLMQGRVDEGRGVQPEDARWLVMCLQRFYGGWDEAASAAAAEGEATARLERAAERRRLLDWFATGDERFSVEKLLEEAERMG